jgi:hypothetical protein
MFRLAMHEEHVSLEQSYQELDVSQTSDHIFISD